MSLTIFGKSIEEVRTFKYFGVVISSDLQWRDLIYYITSKASICLGFTYRNLRFISITAKVHLYMNSVLPLIFDYRCCVCNPHFKKYIEDLEAVQIFAYRIISGNYSAPFLNWSPYLSYPNCYSISYNEKVLFRSTTNAKHFNWFLII